MERVIEDGFIQLAFPDDDDGPAFGLQLAPDFLVPLLVAGDFRLPKLSVGFRDVGVLAVFVAMPEAAVDEDDGAVLGEDDIRFAGQFLVVYPIAESLVPKGMTQLQLRLCGGGVDGGHVAMALVWSEDVRHVVQSYIFSSVSTKWLILTNCQQNSLSLPSY